MGIECGRFRFPSLPRRRTACGRILHQTMVTTLVVAWRGRNWQVFIGQMKEKGYRRALIGEDQRCRDAWTKAVSCQHLVRRSPVLVNLSSSPIQGGHATQYAVYCVFPSTVIRLNGARPNAVFLFRVKEWWRLNDGVMEGQKVDSKGEWRRGEMRQKRKSIGSLAAFSPFCSAYAMVNVSSTESIPNL